MRATISVGMRIRELRKERSFSQEQLALRADLTTSYIGMLERGLKSPTVDTLDKISGALEISIEELFISSRNGGSQYQVRKLSDKIEELPEQTKAQFLENVSKIASLLIQK